MKKKKRKKKKREAAAEEAKAKTKKENIFSKERIFGASLSSYIVLLTRESG